MLCTERCAAGINHKLVTIPSPQPAKRTSDTVRNVPWHLESTSPPQVSHRASCWLQVQLGNAREPRVAHRPHTTTEMPPLALEPAATWHTAGREKSFLLKATEVNSSASKHLHRTLGFHAEPTGPHRTDPSYHRGTKGRTMTTSVHIPIISENEMWVDAPIGETVLC